MPRTTLALAALLALGSSSLAAQQGAYAPTYENPNGREIVAVLLSHSTCSGNRYPGFLEAVDSMNRSLARQARERHLPFVAVGISADWEPDTGFAYLKRLSAFDEMVVGRNWFNLGFAHYVWADSAGRPVVPQVLVLERSTGIQVEGGRVVISDEHVIARYPGPRQIVDWVKAGAPLP